MENFLQIYHRNIEGDYKMRNKNNELLETYLGDNPHIDVFMVLEEIEPDEFTAEKDNDETDPRRIPDD